MTALHRRGGGVARVSSFQARAAPSGATSGSTGGETLRSGPRAPAPSRTLMSGPVPGWKRTHNPRTFRPGGAVSRSVRLTGGDGEIRNLRNRLARAERASLELGERALELRPPRRGRPRQATAPRQPLFGGLHMRRYGNGSLSGRFAPCAPQGSGGAVGTFPLLAAAPRLIAFRHLASCASACWEAVLAGIARRLPSREPSRAVQSTRSRWARPR